MKDKNFELKPEYIEKLKMLDKGSFGKTFNSVEELREHIEKQDSFS